MEQVCYTQRQKQHPGERRGKARAPELQWPNRSDRTSVVKTLVIFSEVTQFMPLNNQVCDFVHQAAEVGLVVEEEHFSYLLPQTEK